MKKRVELYPEERIRRLTRGKRIWTALAVLVALLSLAACIVLCLRANTATEDRNELLTLVVSGIGGCIVIFLHVHLIRAGRAELRHAANLREEEETVLRGRVTVLPGRFRIPDSITVQQLRIETPAGETLRASVIARQAKLLKKHAGLLTLYTAHGYVVAFEDAYEKS